jgi:pimeloyl-ACP methyl ester carboxylesterase
MRRLAPRGAQGRTVAPLLRNDPPAPVDPEIAALPGARGFWMPDDEYGQVYVVTVGPAHAPAGPTLVLVHGLGTDGMRDWYPVLAPLAEHRRVVMFDLPGFGRSGHANMKYAPARYAAVMSRVIAGYGPGRSTSSAIRWAARSRCFTRPRTPSRCAGW